MRIESSVTSISWIPSEAVTGMTKLPFEVGVTHYDNPPPDVIDDLEGLGAADGFRFANRLRAWIEVENGKIVDHAYAGGAVMGSTTVRLGKQATFQAVGFPELQREPEVTPTSVRFVQTAGGRPAIPAPRRVRHPPFVQLKGPTVWSTLGLTIGVDGTARFDLAGASSFPRHWVYDAAGKLAQKAGLTDFKEWYRHAFGKHTPWGDEDSKVLVTTVETALERELSRVVMRGGGEPKIKKLRKGKTLTKQGEPGDEVFLLLDGILSVNVDNEPLAELGPGAILGERAVLEGGVRTSTLRAVTKCKVAAVPADHLDPEALTEISKSHRREET
ncbi:MAG: cyclic nucleotide-binding domain-containing protein [Acidimicrobiia bacterium]